MLNQATITTVYFYKHML